VDLKLELKEWRLKAPFVTAAEVVNSIEVLHVTVSQGGISGRAETMGVDYLGETVASLQAELSALDPLAIGQ
jgi:ribosomal protein S9